MTIVTTEAGLRAAIVARETELVVANDIRVTAPIDLNYTLTLRGLCGASLFWASPSADARELLRIASGGALTLASLTLDAEGRDGSFVTVAAGGTFTMGQNTILRRITSTTAARAVTVNGGTFQMNGGLITAITSSEAILADGGSVFLRGIAQVRDNAARGITLSSAALTMNDRARIIGNRTNVYGGGVLLTNGARLTMDDNATVSCNTALQTGGGIFVDTGSELHLSGHALIECNKALSGNGIHQGGMLTLAASPRVLDGVFFDTAQHAPTVLAPLTNAARITVECSAYVTPQNVPVTLAVGGDGTAALTPSTRAAFSLPVCFHEAEHQIALDDTLKQVQVAPLPPAVSFSPNGGCVRNLPRPVPIEADQSAKLPCTTPRRSGHRFLCWSTAPWGDGQSALPCQTIRTAEQSLQLYARWVKCR